MSTSLSFNLNRLSNPELVQREMALETEAATIAIQRCQEQIEEQGLGSLRVTKNLSKNYMPKLTELIRNWVTEAGKAKKKPKAWKYIESCEPVALAYIVEQEVLRSIPKEVTTATSLCKAVGQTLRHMVEYETFAALNKEEAKKVKQRLRYAPSDHKALRVINRAFDKVDFDRFTWEPEEMAAIGLTMVTLFMEASELVDFKDIMSKGKKEKRLRLTEQGAEWFASAANREALMQPYHFPMVIPPLAWTSPYDGGYLDKKTHGLSLVRARRRSVNRALEAADMDEVYAAVNAIQATPWRINKRVAEVFCELYAAKKPVAGLPAHEEKVVPKGPWPEDLSYDEVGKWMEANDVAAKVWKRKAAEVYKENAKQESKLFGTEMKHKMVERFIDEEAIYFPHNLDFRQRIYPAAGVGAINPQGDDSGKALLEFACGKPLGENGGFWLAVHLSNVWGDDKLPMQERCDRAVERTAEILSYAVAPLQNTGWMKADKPFCFLAACFEWEGFMEQGDNFVSYLPVAMDGSCSGLQHYAAILRDEGTAKAVNVVPSGDLPADVYMEVRDSVADMLEGMSDPMAKEWLPRLKRSSVKQPVMTTVYGVTGRGMRDQIKAAIIKATDKGDILPFSVSASEAANWLAPYVEKGIQVVVAAAAKAMDWLAEVSTILANKDIPLRWDCPTGFPVTQDYRESVSKRMDIMVKGKRVQLTVQKDGTRVSKRRQSNGLPPNFIHSMDSSHLIKTFARCLHEGVDTFAAIHDSFGVHACDTDILNAVLREEFISMYDRDTLKEFYNGLTEYVPEDVLVTIPQPPALGSLDLELVKSSEFFFA